MNTPIDPQKVKPPLHKYNAKDQLEFTKALWEEYKYRHDLCWRVIFRLTAAIVVLSIIPYLNRDIVRILQWRTMFLPSLATALVIFGFMLIRNELKVFQNVKDQYRKLQERVFRIEQDEDVITFRRLVLVYFLILFLLSLTNLFFVWGIWNLKIELPQPDHSAPNKALDRSAANDLLMVLSMLYAAPGQLDR